MAWLTWLSGCAALKDLIPQGAVYDYSERRAAFPGELPSMAHYSGPPMGSVPVPPIQVFGVSYDLDIVLQSQHPDWDMHEYALLRTPAGPVWLAKDARRSDKEQSIIADLPDIERYFPEIPVVKRRSPVQVDDRSTVDELDVRIRYDNLDGVPVDMSYRGPIPRRAVAARNSSTMGHSSRTVAAVLDLSHREFGREASITIGGEPQKLHRVLGLVPMKVLLVQTQGGFSVGDYTFGPADAGPDASVSGGARSVHAGGIAQAWRVEQGPGWTELVQDDPVRSLHYRFLQADGGLELASVRVVQSGATTDTVHAVFRPALPDVRRGLLAPVRGSFVVDIGGQASHGRGTWVAEPSGAGVRLRIQPEAPEWFAERPMCSVVMPVGEGWRVQIERCPAGETRAAEADEADGCAP